MKNPGQPSLPFPDKWEWRGLVRQHLASARAANDPLFALLEEAVWAAIPDIIVFPERYWRQVQQYRNGKLHICYEPLGALRRLQNRFQDCLPRRLALGRSEVATAFGPGCSVFRNAEAHRWNRSSYSVDLADAYGQILTKHVYRYLRKRCLAKSVAWIVARLVTYRGRLVRGGVTSPLVFNCLFEAFDAELASALEPYRVTVTRYCDDIACSSPELIFPVEAKNLVRKLIEHHGFRLNGRKTREGRHGVLILPGLAVVHGRVQPRLDYAQRFARDYLAMSPRTLRGHLAYQRQFPRSGRRWIRRRTLESTS